MENILAVTFNNDGDIYHTLSDLKNTRSSFQTLTAIIIEKKSGNYSIKDGFDLETGNDHSVGGSLIGALIGVIGGPVGLLLGGGFGLVIGSMFDLDNLDKQEDTIRAVTMGVKQNGLILVMIAREDGPEDLDEFLSEHGAATISREQVENVQLKIETAKNAEKQLKKDARKEIIEQNKEDIKQKVKEKNEKIKSKFDNLKVKD